MGDGTKDRTFTKGAPVPRMADSGTGRVWDGGRGRPTDTGVLRADRRAAGAAPTPAPAAVTVASAAARALRHGARSPGDVPLRGVPRRRIAGDVPAPLRSRGPGASASCAHE